MFGGEIQESFQVQFDWRQAKHERYFFAGETPPAGVWCYCVDTGEGFNPKGEVVNGFLAERMIMEELDLRFFKLPPRAKCSNLETKPRAQSKKDYAALFIKEEIKSEPSPESSQDSGKPLNNIDELLKIKAAIKATNSKKKKAELVKAFK